MSINRVVITGNLTRDAELRTTASGTAVLSIGVAVNDRRRNAQGEWEDYANFVNCVMFGSRAEKISQYLKKGQKVGIEGKLRWSQWETNDGQKRSKLEVLVDDLEFLSSRNSDGQGGGYQGGNSYNSDAHLDASAYSAPSIPVDTNDSVYDSEIPF